MSYALITGAAKGIGRAIAIELAQQKRGLILIDIDERQLLETAQYIRDKYYVDIVTIVQDLSAQDAVANIFSRTQWYHNYLNIVINNAGYGLNAPFAQLNIEEQLNIVDVNIKAQLRLAHAFIPILNRFSQSYLLNVGSTTCYQSVPYLSVYAASKAFVMSFTRSLRYELKASSVSVSCLVPGATDTAFVTRAGMAAYTLKTAERFNMSPQTVAKVAVKGMFKSKAEIIPGFSNKLNAYLTRWVPKILVERIAANIYRPREQRREVGQTVITQY
ncbi:SDR family NAD(P)-dependent oxidoreductase [Niabella ginsengisoli]|uniref:SDR family oxidoreductase n=1 Tax=Niabella ginsengisoli TaxID=522298 RepID=A0ABS9SR50_9BACT|nr:SDR family oxidoreductase [Niabella ginsengisoli]MCH5600834.1 SDR family oxidoreductase [Niabella ginsengisoli]